MEKKIDSIQITEVQISDEMIALLESSEHPHDIFLNIWIQAYELVLREEYPHVEILYVGNHYMVVEDCVYIAHYISEVPLKFRIVNTIKKLLKKFGK